MGIIYIIYISNVSTYVSNVSTFVNTHAIVHMMYGYIMCIFRYVYIYVSQIRWLSKLVDWELFLYADHMYNLVVAIIMYITKRISQSDLWALLRSWELPLQTLRCFSFCHLCVNALFSRLKIWCYALYNDKYCVLSMKWFTLISILQF